MNIRKVEVDEKKKKILQDWKNNKKEDEKEKNMKKKKGLLDLTASDANYDMKNFVSANVTPMNRIEMDNTDFARYITP